MGSSSNIEEVRKLVDQFRRNIKQYKSPAYDEANVRVDFIDKLFELLDWDVRNVKGYSEDYRDVVREDKVVIAGKPKAPDYSFRIGGLRKFFVEAKKPAIDIKKEISPAFQVRRYAYSAKLPLSILTDFEEFSVYNTRIKPGKKDKAGTARIFYCTFDEYEKHFDFIYDTFSKPAVLKGSFDRYVGGKKGKRGTSEVDREFLKVIDGWRNELARNIALRNAKLDIYDLNNAVQKIIDRIIFLRIAEDNHMEDYGMLMAASREARVYTRLNDIFAKANIKYNSGLFQFEHWLTNLKIDNRIESSVIQGLYFPECPYEFSVLPIEILGNIYEQFLGKTIRLTPSHRAKVEDKPEVRKAGGVYYTPQYIVDYIVEHTVGEKVKGKKPEDTAKLKILDPACGSGSFLVGAFKYILDYHLKYYTKKPRLKKSLRDSNIYQVSENTFRLTIQEKQAILLNNIFGVDIDSQAVEVTKLSLLLKLMQGESIESAGSLFKHSDLTLLPDLSDNIKCGNSLIGSDYYDNQNLSLFDNGDMRKVNAFDWDKEFPAI
ncbi:MAG: N-6 DNA methylase, partial [Candidatus Krumholzibacteria bacterium]|nr:N-6 DNA methylase [Candidatus Krumholzibacteria bacterium]